MFLTFDPAGKPLSRQKSWSVIAEWHDTTHRNQLRHYQPAKTIFCGLNQKGHASAMMLQSCVDQIRLCLHLTPGWPETFLRHDVDIKRSAARRHFNSRNLLTYLSDITASGVISRGSYGSNRDVKGQTGPKYHKRMKGYEHALTESKDSKRGVVVVGGGCKAFWGWWRWCGDGGLGSISAQSTELKGGPCTNETQFHATLSFPVLFPGFHFH